MALYGMTLDTVLGDFLEISWERKFIKVLFIYDTHKIECEGNIWDTINQILIMLLRSCGRLKLLSMWVALVGSE